MADRHSSNNDLGNYNVDKNNGKVLRLGIDIDLPISLLKTSITKLPLMPSVIKSLESLHCYTISDLCSLDANIFRAQQGNSSSLGALRRTVRSWASRYYPQHTNMNSFKRGTTRHLNQTDKKDDEKHHQSTSCDPLILKPQNNVISTHDSNYIDDNDNSNSYIISDISDIRRDIDPSNIISKTSIIDNEVETEIPTQIITSRSSKTKSFSVLNTIHMYIKDSKKPVSLDQLYDEFVIKRKINNKYIQKSMICNDNIIELENNIFWSVDNIRLSSTDINKFDSLISNITYHCHKYSNLYYNSLDIIPSVINSQSLNGMLWNEGLIKLAFKKSTRFNCFGDNGICVVDTFENPDVNNIESFFHALLENEFMGWSTFSTFVNYCKSYSIMKHIEPEFFDGFSTIHATEFSIEII